MSPVHGSHRLLGGGCSLIAAGLEPSQFSAAESQWTPLAGWDERAAWTGTYPGQPDVPIRVETAAYRGRLVYFEIIEPWTKPVRERSNQQQRSLGWLPVIVIWLTLIAIIILGWVSNRRGRGDRRGAFRIAGFLSIMVLLTWLFSFHHASIVQENIVAYLAVLIAAGVGIQFWGCYLALEPFIRRRLPETIITWNRLLAGQFRDPVLGRDVLIGLLTLAVFHVVRIVTHFVSVRPIINEHNEALLGGSHNLGVLSNALLWGFSGPLFMLLFFFLLRLFVRKPWLAAVGVVLLLTLASVSNFSVVNVTLWLLPISMQMFLLLRFGLVAACIWSFANEVLHHFPVTTNFSVWYASSGLFAIAVLIALAVYAFYTSLGGQKVFAGKLLEE